MTRRWRLFPKYALLIITLVGSMLVASGAIGLYFSWQETKKNLVDLQREKAGNAANRIEQYILEIEHELSWTALPRADANGDALEQRRIEYLKLQRQAPAITEVVWIDPQGREQLRISRLAMDVIGSGADVSQEKRFQVASAGRPYYGPVYFRKGTEPYMTIARPAGSGGGVTAAEVNLKFVLDEISKIRIGANGLAYVVDSTGTLIAHPDISLVLKKSDLSALPQVAAALRDARADGPPPVARDLKGEEVLSAHEAIPTLGWTVFVDSPRSEAFAPLYATLRTTSLVLVAALLISIAASFFLARALVRPLRALQEGAAQIGAGDLDRHIVVRTGDELEGLAEQFNRMTAELRESYAGLERKVEQRTAELSEALEQQTATAEILGVISGSVADSQPVFEKILESCAQLFSSSEQGILLVGDDERVYLGAHRGGARERLAPLFPSNIPPGASTTIFGGEVMHFRNVLTDPDVPPGIRAVGERIGIGEFSQLFAPLVWEGRGIGSLYVTRHPPVGFQDKEIGLLKTFAAQAVIAIQNARLFNETKEALEQQTASADVLNAINKSPTDVQPVFDVIAERAMTLCDARIGGVARFDGELLHLVAYHGVSQEIADAMRATFPIRPGRGAVTARAVVERAPVQIADVFEDPEFTLSELALRAGFRSSLAVPMFREGQVVGSIVVSRRETGAFPAKLVRLLQTFADQAVIAIENVRLFNETKEALEQQTATAEVLQVISSSVADTQPVFDKILDSSERLFAATALGIYLVDDAGMLHIGGFRGESLGPSGVVREVAGAFPRPVSGTSIEIALRDRRVVHFPDVLGDPSAPPPLRRIAEAMGNLSVAFAPMLWEGRGVGAIQVWRDPPSPFSAKELALLKTFADQAVIAIQNARLFNETREALEQQKASSEVLNVISSSVADTQPVFDRILGSCERLFGGTHVVIDRLGDDRAWHLAAYAGPRREEMARLYPAPLGDVPGIDAEILRRQVTHFPDVAGATNVAENVRRGCELIGCNALVMAPMLTESRRIGTIIVGRDGEPFTAKEMALLQTFADQAVIAIQNSSLFNEIQTKSRELEMANKHKSEFLANMSHELRTPLNAIIGFSEVLSEQMFGEVNEKQLEYLRDIHSSGHHLLSLINDILDLSKIEAGRMELDLTTTSLPMLLDNCTTLVRERASRNGLVLALEVEDRVGDWVADVRKLKQVVINLLANAVKFTPAGGRVTLRARKLEHAVEIAVVDTGVGIAKDQQALVFEEFRQAGGDYLRKSEGTGLGLSLARRFVELHGGSIRVESEPGRGATFAFILPERIVEAVA
ncbi:MAG TPA: GAF domain-containing protein [Caldimonas sp.]|nr:GAF domain-containing protein [Caldimonas sp.]HEX4235819.1 GAF domain-containing protein [Caldimonas sp.]